MENEFYSRDSRRLDLHQKLYSKVLGKRSSHSRHFWECIRSQLERVCGNFGEGRDEKEQKGHSKKLLRSGVTNITHVEEKPEF